MKKPLNVELFFNTANNEIKLTEVEGCQGIKILLDEFHGKLIKEIAGITRSAMINYDKNPKGRISKRGRDGIVNLANYYNSKILGVQSSSEEIPAELAKYSDREILLELIRRGYQLTKEV
jgi:hypothetical protein